MSDKLDELDTDEKWKVVEGLIEEVHYRLECVDSSSNLSNRAHHWIELQNAMSDLITWHSGYDVNSGTLPWQREDEV